ncbi:hypothetical protein NUM3379_36300 [Kineococcus sp. NUM-3379]
MEAAEHSAGTGDAGEDATAFALRAARAAGHPGGSVGRPDVEGGENSVTVLGTGAGRVVVRSPLPGHTCDLDLEVWCARRAAEHGVGAAEVLWLGEVDGRPVLVQRYVPDAGTAEVPAAERWRVLGQLARRTARVPLPPDAPAGLFSRFGRDLPTAWVAHVGYNLDALDGDDLLVTLGVHSAAERGPLRDLLAEARELRLDFGLVHGDLAPRNLRVVPGAAPVLLDWGSATTGPVPFTDLVHLLRKRSEVGEPSGEHLAAFLDGWGEAVEGRAVALTRLVSSLDLVRWALDRAPGRVAEQVRVARREVRRALPLAGGA